MVVTDHAYKRLKECCGWSKSTADRMIEKVMQDGTDISEVKGWVRRWIEGKTFNCGSQCSKIYGEMLYVIDGECLVTVFHVPTKVRVKNKVCGKHIDSFKEVRKQCL